MNTTPSAPGEEILHATHVATLRALDLAGKRMINRAQRGAMQPIPPWQRHTFVPVHKVDLDKLLVGVWDLLGAAYPDHPQLPALVSVADRYVRDLLTAGEEHDIQYLRVAFERAEWPDFSHNL